MKKFIGMISGLLLSASFAGCFEDGPKHVILFIGDGMQLEHEIAASRYITGKDNGLVFHSFPYRGSCTTWDIDAYNYYASLNGENPYDAENFNPLLGYNPDLGGANPYPLSFLDTQLEYFVGHGSATDSASAATAMSTGLKTNKGNIAWLPGDPENGALLTIAEQLRRDLGYSIGVVSTVPASHATPAAFVSHNVYRNNYFEIANETAMITKPEVVIGGGHHVWNGRYQYLAEADYNTVKNSDEWIFVERQDGVDGGTALKNAADLARKYGKRLYGYFGGKGGNFEPPVPLDNPGNPAFSLNPENPALKDCVKSTLDVLGSDPDGFFVMFEQGDIDWANHANNYPWMIGTVYDLNEAVKAAIKYVEKPGDDIDWSNTLIIVTSDHSNSYMRLNDGMKLGKGDLPTMEGADYSHAYPDGEVTYASTDHTNEPVMLYAKGCGAQYFKKFQGKWYPKTKLIDNTNIYELIKGITGLE